MSSNNNKNNYTVYKRSVECTLVQTTNVSSNVTLLFLSFDRTIQKFFLKKKLI